MGAKFSFCSSKKNRNLEEEIILPELDESIFPIHFKVITKSFWGIGLWNINVCLEIDFFQQETLKTSYIYSDVNPLWNIHKKVDIIFNSVQDFSSYFSVNLINEKKKVIGRMNIPFYTLAKGTLLNNFPFESKKSYQGRLEFQMKISQKIKISLIQEKIHL